MNPALDAAGFAHLRRGLEFNGTTDFSGNATEFVELQNPLPIGDRSHTVEVWVKVPSAGTGGLGENERVGIILGNLNSNTDPGNANWEIDDEGKLRIFWNGGEFDLGGSKDLRDDQWHHVAFVRDKDQGEFKLYVDGIPDLSLIHI